jgi:uncharacterized tellurite resistance protein B-like protein
MEIRDLTPEENLALVGLLKLVIQADKLYSRKESAELKRVAGLMGTEVFHRTVEEARLKFTTLADVETFAATITRQVAREQIYNVVLEMARVDGIPPAEQGSLDWLARLWNIDQP